MITLKTELVVKAINILIEEAVCDGGDSGGAYHQNQEDLRIAIDNLLKTLYLSEDYEVGTIAGCSSWSKLKIQPKSSSFQCLPYL